MYKQMSLLPDHNNPVNKILKIAICSFSDAEARWKRRRETGLSDEDLARATSYEFGTLAGDTLDGMCYELRGRKNPTLSYTYLSHEDAKRMRLSRKQLLNKVREICSISLSES